MITIERIKKQGQYLGYCDQKGYIYSVFTGYTKEGNKQYRIVCILNNDIDYLIDFEGSL